MSRYNPNQWEPLHNDTCECGECLPWWSPLEEAQRRKFRRKAHEWFNGGKSA